MYATKTNSLPNFMMRAEQPAIIKPHSNKSPEAMP